MILQSLKKTITSFLDSDPFTYAASLAFYTVVSLPAILMIAINVLSTAYERDVIQEGLLNKLNFYLGPNTVNQAEVILENATMDASGVIPQIIGWAVLLFSATTVFISLQNGINRIWSVRQDSNTGFIKIIIDRLLSFAMIASLGFVLLVSLVLDSMIVIFESWIADHLGQAHISFAWIGNIVLSMFFTTLIFSLIYKVLPDVKTKWKHCWVGGFFTALMFLGGKYFIGLYLGTANVGNPYGASGSLVIFLFWVYYSSSLVLFGAKFTYEYAISSAERIEVEDHSVFVNKVALDKDKLSTSRVEDLKL